MKSGQVRFCPGELILESLARIDKWHQNLREYTEREKFSKWLFIRNRQKLSLFTLRTSQSYSDWKRERRRHFSMPVFAWKSKWEKIDCHLNCPDQEVNLRNRLCPGKKAWKWHWLWKSGHPLLEFQNMDTITSQKGWKKNTNKAKRFFNPPKNSWFDHKKAMLIGYILKICRRA